MLTYDETYIKKQSLWNLLRFLVFLKVIPDIEVDDVEIEEWGQIKTLKSTPFPLRTHFYLVRLLVLLKVTRKPTSYDLVKGMI